MSKSKYEAPKLTRYGKPSEFIEAGSVAIATGDVTSDGIPDTLFDTDGDGLGDVLVGGATGNQTPVTFANNIVLGNAGYDGPDDDTVPGIFVSGNSLGRLFFDSLPTSESSDNDGWNDPARD